MIKVGIVGGTGYTGIELIRLLMLHPEVEIKAITSRTEAGKKLSQLAPNFIPQEDLIFSPPTLDNLAACDLVFFATPNGTAMQMVPDLLAAGIKVIDLAADFRIQDQALWEHWYQQDHACPELLPAAVYGLPEINRELIRNAQLVANPGCYPTAVALALIPLLEQGLIATDTLIADVKSGVSGAGRAANIGTLHAEVSENFKAYASAGHRHQPEIEQTLRQVAQTDAVQLTFIPHLVPMNRGIHATCYARVGSALQQQDLTSIYQQRYLDEQFVSLLAQDQHPETRAVRGSNQCIIAVKRVSEQQVVVLSVIDNLVKGAAGQAVQNMNIMYGLPEVSGLDTIALLP